MDKTTKYFEVYSLDMDRLLPVIIQIRREGLLDSKLKVNLEFSNQVLKDFPASKRRDVSLMVEGECLLVHITAGTPSLFYMVHLDSNGPQFHQRGQAAHKLAPSNLTERHFAGHRCRDELKSCLEQAREALIHGTKKNPSFQNEVELKITCGELHLTYSSDQSLHTVYIQPRRRVHLGKTMALERILETKTHLEKSGEMGRSLLTCFNYLLQNANQYFNQHPNQLFTQHQEENSRVVLQGDGEMVEFVSSKAEKYTSTKFIYTDTQNQAHVQDVFQW